MKTLFLLLLVTVLSLYSNTAQAQQKNINGIVRDATGVIPAATVSLLNSKDSSWIQSALTDDKGAFTFADIPAGNYLVSVTAIGYTTVVQPSSNSPMTILLQKETTSLKEVSIAAKKPFIEMNLGKIVVNTEASPTTAGINVLELLRKMPGITVDMQGNIGMQGKQGVQVMIDDRPTYLSADQLAEYLKSIPSDEIEQIELISQPSAKYDAAGNAGIINLKRKKIKKTGINGTATGTLGQGIYPFATASGLLSYRKNKLSLILSGNLHDGKGAATWNESQLLSDPQTSIPASIAYLNNNSHEEFAIYRLQLSADYRLTDKATMGISANGGYHTNTSADNVFSTTTDAQTNTTTYNSIYSPSHSLKEDLSTNAYYMVKYNAARELDINLDYVSYSNNPYQCINNTAYDEQMLALPNPLFLQSHQPSQINIYSVKGDYTDTLSNGIKLEAGYKSSYVTTDNNAYFTTFQNNGWINDTTRTNDFTYKENINALYGSAYKAFDSKWEARAGLRIENTNTQGIQQIDAQSFTRSYTSLFPTADVTWKANKDNQFELDYGRRIDRPSYQSLNPFIFYSFQYSYSVGNPYLQPQYTNSIELKHSFKNMIITTVGFTNTTGVMNQVLIPNNTTGVLYSTQANTGTNNAISFSTQFNKDIFKWWSVNAYFSCFYAHYNGMADNLKLVASGPGLFTGMSSQFSFKKGWKAEYGIYYSGSYIQSIVAKSLPSTYIDFGISKKCSDHSNFKLTVADPFYIYRFKQQYNMPGLQTNDISKYSTQSVALAYTYTFGQAVSNKEFKKTEEAQRIK